MAALAFYSAHASYTIFAPTDASLFALDMIQTASSYNETLRLHFVLLRLSLYDLQSISSAPSSPLTSPTSPSASPQTPSKSPELTSPCLAFSTLTVSPSTASSESSASALSFSSTGRG
ncbi:hypothetical protein ACLB2K_066747 [Fragaria x ananassa]